VRAAALPVHGGHSRIPAHAVAMGAGSVFQLADTWPLPSGPFPEECARLFTISSGAARCTLTPEVAERYGGAQAFQSA